MVRWSLLSKDRGCGFVYSCKSWFIHRQNRSLVNVKLKWVKDKTLDTVLTGAKDVKAVCTLVTVISSVPERSLPIFQLSRHRGQLGLPSDLKLATFIRRYPSIFIETHARDSSGTRVPCFGLTSEACELREEELYVVERNQRDILGRLCKLLMLTKDRVLPLQTIDQLKWELGLPYDCHQSLIPRHRNLFSFVELLDKRVGLKLDVWDDDLAVSELQKNSSLQSHEDVKNNCLAFPVGFTRGFGLKRKCMEWLKEWQKLPYTSPYSRSSHLDSRTDVSEKRIVGVFHELLHLAIEKRIERKNLSNLRMPLALPQKFTKVFERHPGIFYISKKSDTQTVILREAYDGHKLLHRHPLVEIREKFSRLLKEGLLDRSRGFYKKRPSPRIEEASLDSELNVEVNVDRSSSDDEYYTAHVTKYDTDHHLRDLS